MISIKKSWWLQLLLAVVVPIGLLFASYHVVALLFPGTIKHNFWLDIQGVTFLLSLLPIIYLLTRANGQTPIRILSGVFMVAFFMLLAVSTRLSSPCGEIPEYIGDKPSIDSAALASDDYVSECE